MLATAVPAERLAIDLHGLQGLKARAARADAEALLAAARQFEALLLQTLLREMRQTRFTTATDAFADSDTIRLYRELLDQQWAQKIVQTGGLGLAEAMARLLQRQQAGVVAAGEADQKEMGPRASRHALPVSSRPAEPREGGSVPPAPAALTVQDEAKARRALFIQRVMPHAKVAAQQTGLPVTFILAHAALESGWGAGEIRWADGRGTHNLFGIKAGDSWRGESVTSETVEYRQGLPMRVSERFRAYAGYSEAFADYAQLLRSRYATAVQAAADAQAFAQALAAGGYATDPAYASKLQGVIASVARMLA